MPHATCAGIEFLQVSLPERIHHSNNVPVHTHLEDTRPRASAGSRNIALWILGSHVGGGMALRGVSRQGVARRDVKCGY